METYTSPWLLAADIWRILSKSFSYPDENNRQQVRELCKILVARELADLPAGHLLNQLELAVAKEQVVDDYSRLFLRGSIPLNESFCSSKLDSVADVSAFYKAFGLKSRSGDAPDSLAYELEFLSVLCVKYALANEDEQREVCESAYFEFLQDHLKGFKDKLKERMQLVDGGEFYPLALNLLDYFTEEQYKALLTQKIN